MVETELVKPKVIQAFEKRFKIESDHWGDVFFFRITSSGHDWQDFLQSAFCFVNDCSLKEENLNEAQDLKISREGVTLTGRFLQKNIWGSDCLLAQGKLKTPSPNSLTIDIYDGVYLLSPAGSDTGDFKGK